MVGKSTHITLVIVAALGCGQAVKLLPGTSWHKKLGWKAEDYFDDPKVIALCKAIEADDIAEIDRLVAAGADVNAQGKDKMTPLLWAYPDNKLDRFKRLLELGADPNVIVESTFGRRTGLTRGESVTHMACKTTFPGYFDAVLDHGGDPNLDTGEPLPGLTPLVTVVTSRVPDKKHRVRVLLDKGAKIDRHPPGSMTAAMWAVGAAQFDIVLMLLEAGADFTLVTNDHANTRLMHQLIIRKTHMGNWTPQQLEGFNTVIRWLEEHGDSRKEAQADLDRWDAWSDYDGESQRNMAAEVAARKKREAEAKQQAGAAQKPDQ